MKTKKIINALLVSAVANKVSDIFFFSEKRRDSGRIQNN